MNSVDPAFIASARSRHTRKPLHDRIDKLFKQLDEWELPTAAEELLFIDKEIEAQMGIYADAITKLESTCTSQQSTITSLTAQLAASQKLEPDSSDESAAKGVDSFIGALTPAATDPVAPVVETPVTPAT